MVEQIMFFSGGFLVASLLALILMPVVHRRAVRITSRDLKDSVPLSVRETLAQVDGLRAEFAISTRRLELQVEQLKVRAANQLGEIGRLRAYLAKSSWRARDLLKVESRLGADTQIEHVSHFEPDSAERRRHAYPDARRSQRAGSIEHLKKSLVEHEQFLNRCDVGITAAFVKIASGRTGLGRKDPEAQSRPSSHNGSNGSGVASSPGGTRMFAER
jgi:hypothetical protein